MTVYLVPHSHDDVGWCDTIQYLYDNKAKHIYSTVVKELAENRQMLQVGPNPLKLG